MQDRAFIYRSSWPFGAHAGNNECNVDRFLLTGQAGHSGPRRAISNFMHIGFIIADMPMLAGIYYLQIKSMLMKGHAGRVGPSGRHEYEVCCCWQANAGGQLLFADKEYANEGPCWPCGPKRALVVYENWGAYAGNKVFTQVDIYLDIGRARFFSSWIFNLFQLLFI